MALRFLRRAEYSRPALVLSGGSSLGAVQVGILKALLEVNFRPGLIVGTSVGAINGAFLATRAEPDIRELARIWLSLRANQVFERNWLKVGFRLATRRPYLFGNAFLTRLIEQNLPVKNFPQTATPLYVTATNLTRGTKHVFHEGALAPAILASCAIPGVFAPVEIGGELFVDGGYCAHLDLETAVEAGAREILAVDLSQLATTRPMGGIGVIGRSIRILAHEQVRKDAAWLATRARIILLRPTLGSAVSSYDFTHTSRLIDTGEALGRELIAGCMRRQGRFTFDPGWHVISNRDPELRPGTEVA
jgi:NTE family protein